MSLKTLLLLPVLCLVYGFCFPKEKTNLILDIDNIEEAKGYVWIGIYDSEKSFLNKDLATAIEGKKITRTGSIQMEIKDVPYGTYAVAIFHDINENGELDQGMFGVPKEPYAFSKPLKSKWRAPTFEDVRFTLATPNQSLRMKLSEWTW